MNRGIGTYPGKILAVPGREKCIGLNIGSIKTTFLPMLTTMGSPIGYPVKDIAFVVDILRYGRNKPFG